MSYKNPRINDFKMSTFDILYALSEGNPGALTVLMDMLKVSAAIDPDDLLAPLGPLLTLDNLDCYGSRIWMLYKDVCGQKINLTLAMLRARQLGFVSDNVLNHAIENRGADIDVQDLYKKVKERLPNFDNQGNQQCVD